MTRRTGDIAIRFYGEGPALLFLHGLAASGVSWRAVASYLPGYRCVAPDLLGFGDSEKPDVSYDLATHCDALEAIVKEHRPRAIVGHSMGAVIGLELLRRFPEIPAGVLVGPAVFASANEAERAFAKHHKVGALTLPSKPLGRLSCAVMCHLRPVLRPILPMFARDLPADVVKAGLDHNWHSMSRSVERVVWAGLVPALLEQVGDRVTVLHGTSDETVPMRQVEQIRHLCKEFLAVEGGHLLPLRQAGAVADAVLARLREGPDAAPSARTVSGA